MNHITHFMLCEKCGHSFNTKDFCHINCIEPVFCDKCESVMFPQKRINITVEAINNIRSTLLIQQRKGNTDASFLLRRLP